ncbi:MAG: class I SAM-dependent methyltransferase [Planctomycetota bacterium]|nr:MAG: class I SAM-dependent methyltransferase [Planctomycetota bacterium]
MDPSVSASDYFGSIIAEYDSLIRRAVPRYEEMSARLVDYLPDRPERILELGAGTGNLTARLAERFGTATITAVDASLEMLDATRSRLGDAAGRLKTVCARFEDLAFNDGSFDLCVSCISLHHVRDKGALFGRLRRWLAPGGWLVFADQFRGATDEIHRVNWDGWLAFCREPGGCSDDEIRELLEHAEAHDHYEPVAAHFDYLCAAGFERGSLDCVWRNLIWGVLTARTPG